MPDAELPALARPSCGRSRRPHPARDRGRARPLRRRPGRGQARGGDRAAQPHPPPAPAARGGRRDHAQEHPDDRAHRRRQDRDRAPPRPPRGSPFLKVEASQVHRGRLRGPRRRVDGARPRGGGGRHGAPREAGGGAREGRTQRRGAPPRPAPAAPRPASAADGREDAARAAEQSRPTREKLREQLRAGALDARIGRDRGAREDVPRLPDPLRPGRRGDGHQRQGHAARPLRGRTTQAPTVPRPRGARGPRARRRSTARRRGAGGARGRRARAELAASSSSTRSTRSRGARAATGPDVSREGVQRDLLPIVEGTTVSTKYGPVRTDHILFIAAGAFHVSKPTDLIPELQGRFPDPRRARAARARRTSCASSPSRGTRSLGQYRALLATEGVELTFTDEAVARWPASRSR